MTKWVEHKNGICWEESTLLAGAGLRHGVTGKSGGVSEAPLHRSIWPFTSVTGPRTSWRTGAACVLSWAIPAEADDGPADP